MKRLHLLEVHEQSWCPSPVRDGLTDLMRLYINRLDAFVRIMPRLMQAMEQAQTRTIVDLCSGGGGPWPSLLKHIGPGDRQIDQVILTDLHPNLVALEEVRTLDPQRVSIEETSVDILTVPPRLRGFRTQFNAFHHFKPEQAQAILQNAVNCGEGIAIFELPERTLKNIVAMAITSPLAAYWGTPFVRPIRPVQYLWTYAVPALPLVLTIDGIVSCLRAYTPAELQAMVEALDAPGYHWDIGIEHDGLLPVTYLIGRPAAGS